MKTRSYAWLVLAFCLGCIAAFCCREVCAAEQVVTEQITTEQVAVLPVVNRVRVTMSPDPVVHTHTFAYSPYLP